MGSRHVDGLDARCGIVGVAGRKRHAATSLCRGRCGSSLHHAVVGDRPGRTERLSHRRNALRSGQGDTIFILFSGADDKTHLIDMDGNEVHRWDHRGFPSDMLDPALVGGARGHVMVQLADMTGSETGMIPGLPACLRTRPSVSSIGIAISSGNGATPRRGVRHSSITIGHACPTAIPWSCLP